MLRWVPGPTRVLRAGRVHGDEAQRGPKLAPDVMHPPPKSVCPDPFHLLN